MTLIGLLWQAHLSRRAVGFMPKTLAQSTTNVPFMMSTANDSIAYSQSRRRDVERVQATSLAICAMNPRADELLSRPGSGELHTLSHALSRIVTISETL